MRLLPILAVALVLAGCASSPAKTTTPSTPVINATDLPKGTQLVTIETAKGSFTFRLDPTLAPKTTAHIASLVGKGFYNNVPFHRYEVGFVLQGGDPKCKGDGWKPELIPTSGCGTGGSGQTVPGEFGGKHDYGAVGLARSQAEDSGDSQFYVVLSPGGAHSLDNHYCVFGFVTSGMDVVNALRAGDLMTRVTLTTA